MQISHHYVQKCVIVSALNDPECVATESVKLI